MILVSHAVIGAAVGRLIPGNPLLAFFVGFISHFLADAIPHWDYKLASAVKTETGMITDIPLNSGFVKDFGKIALDVTLGGIFTLALFSSRDPQTLYAAAAGAFGGILPDALQFVYFKIKREPLNSLQKFHMWIHARRKVKNPILGMFLQGVIAAALVAITALFV